MCVRSRHVMSRHVASRHSLLCSSPLRSTPLCSAVLRRGMLLQWSSSPPVSSSRLRRALSGGPGIPSGTGGPAALPAVADGALFGKACEEISGRPFAAPPGPAGCGQPGVVRAMDALGCLFPARATRDSWCFGIGQSALRTNLIRAS